MVNRVTGYLDRDSLMSAARAPKRSLAREWNEGTGPQIKEVKKSNRRIRRDFLNSTTAGQRTLAREELRTLLRAN